jgi:hypothetical protein
MRRSFNLYSQIPAGLDSGVSQNQVASMLAIVHFVLERISSSRGADNRLVSGYGVVIANCWASRAAAARTVP